MQVGTYEAQQRAKALELRRKFYPTKHVQQVRRLPPAPVVYDIPAFMHLIPSWKKESLHFDEHMMEWRMIVQDTTLSPIKAYIRRRAPQLGFTYKYLTQRARLTRDGSHARFLIMWEIKNYVKPNASFQEIGNAFGGVDHTSAIYGINKIEEWKLNRIEGYV
jgi:hypothetical protein